MELPKGFKTIDLIPSQDLIKTLSSVERDVILQALKDLDGNKTKVANALGISIKGLYNKLHEYGIPLKSEMPPKPEVISKKIECPVITAYSKLKEYRSFQRPKVDRSISVEYTPRLTLDQIQKHWVYSAIEYCNGNFSQAAKLLGIGKATIYRNIREWEHEKK